MRRNAAVRRPAPSVFAKTESGVSSNAVIRECDSDFSVLSGS